MKKETAGEGKYSSHFLELAKQCSSRLRLKLRCRYVEWEEYPEKKLAASRILKANTFSPIPGASSPAFSQSPISPESLLTELLEFQFVPLPKTNPVLIGKRWKEYHEVLGLKDIVDFSWETVQKEKPDLIHLLDFPYNGETRRDQLMQGKITDNKHHL